MIEDTLFRLPETVFLTDPEETLNTPVTVLVEDEGLK
jgi:hypothetical protein